MKTSNHLVETVRLLADANEELTKAEIALEEKKADFINNSGTYGACTNDKQRTAFFAENCATEIKLVRKFEAKREKANVEKEIAEIEWKSEKYDIMAKVGVIA